MIFLNNTTIKLVTLLSIFSFNKVQYYKQAVKRDLKNVR